MARMLLQGFPPAPLDGQFCALCAALAKGTLLAPQMEAVEAGLADDGRDTFTVGVDRVKAAELLQLAVTWAPCPQLGAALAPLCWLHCPAIDGNAPAPESPQQQAPGLFLPGRKRGGLN